jgi:polyhydroxybutyrate depolymerase
MRHWSARRALVGALAAAFAVLGVCVAPASGAAGVYVPVVHGGALRSYRLYVPSALPAGPVPLVVALHGLTGAASSFAGTSRLDDLADLHGFVVVYPEGLSKSWNAGTCCGDSAANDVDDVGFLAQVVTQVSLTLPVDRSRVYAVGFSNGGMMALRAACELPDLFAAVASVNGAGVSPCVPSRPVSVLQVSGGRDALIPYRGTAWMTPLKSPIPATPVVAGGWERANRCSGLPAHTHTQAAEIRSYDSCAGGTSARVVVLPRNGHTWPRGASEGWDATTEVWRFFASRPGASGARAAFDPPAPVLTTRIVATRRRDRVAGLLDGRFDVVLGRRVAVDVWRGGRWITVGAVTTDVEGRFHFVSPGGSARLRLRYAGAPGLPSSAVLA